jgi:hypothetical protein
MAQLYITVVCTFEQSSLRISAHDSYECIFEELPIQVHNVKIIQVGVIKRNVYKQADSACVHTLLRETNGQAAYKHQSGELSHINIEIASLGINDCAW